MSHKNISETCFLSSVPVTVLLHYRELKGLFLNLIRAEFHIFYYSPKMFYRVK